jgi:hypothetical protein
LQLIVLAPVLVAAMLLHELLYGLTSGDDRRAGVRGALRRMARLHAPLSALGILGVAVGLPLLLTGTLAKAAGFYGDTLTGASLDATTFSLARSYVVFLALGLGALPAAIAFGFFGESLVAPSSRRAHAFACLSVLTILVLTLQVAEISVRFDEGVLQERYLFYLAPLLVVGLCAGVLLTRRPFKMILGGSIVLAALAASTHYQTARTAFWYQISPALTGFYDWIRPAFGAPGGAHAEADKGRLVVLGLVVLALGVLVAALARRISAPRLLAGVGVLALLFCGTETVHALSHVVHGTSSGAGLGEGSLRDVSWVDRSVPPGAPVADLVSNVGGLDQSRATWEDNQFWNRSVTSAYTFGPAAVDTYLATTALSVDSSSGAVVLGVHGSAGGAAPPLGYLVAPTRGFPVQLAGTVLGHSRAGTLELLRLAPAPHAAWRVVGVSSDGWLPLQAPATVQLYSLRASRRCARVALTLSLSALSPAARTLVLSGRGVRREVRFAPGQVRTLYTRVCGRPASVPQLQMLDVQSAAAAVPQLTLQLLHVTATPL